MLRRALKIAAVLFVLVLGAVAVTAWIAGDRTELPFLYEGFD